MSDGIVHHRRIPYGDQISSYSIVQCDTILYDTVLVRAVSYTSYHTMSYIMIYYHTLSYVTVEYHALWYIIARHRTFYRIISCTTIYYRTASFVLIHCHAVIIHSRIDIIYYDILSHRTVSYYAYRTDTILYSILQYYITASTRHESRDEASCNVDKILESFSERSQLALRSRK